MSPKKSHNSDTEGSSTIPDTRIEDGKLLFEKRWYKIFILMKLRIITIFQLFSNHRYHRGQPVFVEGRQMAKFPAVISAIGNETVSHILFFVKQQFSNLFTIVSCYH